MTSDLALGWEAGVLPAVLVIVGLLIGLVWLLTLETAPVRGDSSPLLPFSVESFGLQWHDGRRGRTVAARIYYPGEGRGPFPVILVSHSLRGSRDESAYLGRFWAGHGYVCVHLQHKGSDLSAWSLLGPRQSLQQARHNHSYLLDRIGDLTFAIEQLEDLNRRHCLLAALLDLSRLGVVGLDFGAVAALALAGQVAAHTPEPVPLQAACIKAVMTLGEPIAPDDTLQPPEFACPDVPVFSMVAATQEFAAYEPDRGTQAWPARLPSAIRYQLSFSTPNPLVFLGPSVARQPGDLSICAVIQQTSQVFWDAYLKEDQRAQAWLAAGQAEVALPGCGRLRRDFAETLTSVYGSPLPQSHYQTPEMWCC